MFYYERFSKLFTGNNAVSTQMMQQCMKDMKMAMERELVKTREEVVHGLLQCTTATVLCRK
jgi:hypothetical protein